VPLAAGKSWRIIDYCGWGEQVLLRAEMSAAKGIFAENCPPFDKSWPMVIIQDFPLPNKSANSLDEMEGSDTIKGSPQIAPGRG